MSLSPRHRALIAVSLVALALGAPACFAPVEHLRSRDTGPRLDAGPDGGAGDAGGLDGACPECLPSCPGSCEAADGGCGAWRSITAAPVVGGCPISGFSVGLGSATVRASYCACGTASLAEGSVGPWGVETITSGCVRTMLRTDPVTDAPRILLEQPGGVLQIAERSKPGGRWTFDSPPQIDPPAGFVIEGSGDLHLVGAGQGALLYASRIDKKWHVETAAAAPTLTPGSQVVVALGPEGELAVAFSTGELRVARKTAAGWVSSTVASAGLPVGLSVDALGRPHVLYLQDGLRYAVQTQAGWVNEAVDPEAIAGALALGEGGCARAAWTSAGGLSYGERTEQGWTQENLADAGFSGLDEPLVLLPDGKPLVGHGSPLVLTSH